MNYRIAKSDCAACRGTGHMTVRGRAPARRVLRYIEGLTCQVCAGTGKHDVRAERYLWRMPVVGLLRHVRELAAQAPIRWPLHSRGLAVVDARDRLVFRFEATAGRYQWEARNVEAVVGLLNAVPVLLGALDTDDADE